MILDLVYLTSRIAKSNNLNLDLVHFTTKIAKQRNLISLQDIVG